MIFTRPVVFAEALEKLGRRQIVAAGLDTQQWRYLVPLAFREQSFWSSQIESVRFLQRAKNRITDFLAVKSEMLPNGEIALKVGGRADFIADMQKFAIAEGMGPIEPTDAGTLKDITSERRLGLIFDTQTRQAQDFGNWQQGMDPDVLDAYPAQRFVRERAVTVRRQSHLEFEGVVRLKSDVEFWRAVNQDFQVPWGPWGWGCGHDVEDVPRKEAERLGLIAPGEAAKPVALPLNENLQASISGLDPEILRLLIAAFGAQVKISGDTAFWGGQTARELPSAAAIQP